LIVHYHLFLFDWPKTLPANDFVVSLYFSLLRTFDAICSISFPVCLFELAIQNKCPENLVLFEAHIPAEAKAIEPEYFVEETPMPDTDYRDLIEMLSKAESVLAQHRLIR